MSWDIAEKAAKRFDKKEGDLFVKLTDDGDSIVGAFVGDPYTREVHWTGERYEPCAHHGCELCKKIIASVKISLNFFVPETKRMMVIEGGPQWFQSVLLVRGKYGLDKWFFEVTRKGAKGNPKTTYSILPDRQIDDDIAAEMQLADLVDLDALFNKQASGGGKSFDSTISPQKAKEIDARLRKLPTATGKYAFSSLKENFGVQKISMIKEGDLLSIEKMISDLESPAPTQASFDDDDIPF